MKTHLPDSTIALVNASVIARTVANSHILLVSSGQRLDLANRAV